LACGTIMKQYFLFNTFAENGGSRCRSDHKYRVQHRHSWTSHWTDVSMNNDKKQDPKSFFSS
jgi:hypothetical protein